jgi:bifunctional non-homologous end joining protein LigD
MEEQTYVTVEGNQIRISNPQKLLWEDPPITKAEYLRKLAILAPYLLRYCRRRYLTTIRYPHGINGPFFYQKNCPEPAPEFVRTAELNGVNYVDLDSLSTLIWLGNLACLEFHPSFHHIGSERPAEWVIDMDPPQEDDPRLVDAALMVGEVLDKLGITAVPKTSGATGIQFFIPIEPRYTFQQLRALGEFIGRYLAETKPDLFTIERLKKKRRGLIYFDYLQIWPGKTLSAPYTPRARSFAPVSTPLKWSELTPSFHPRHFNLETIEQRLEQYGDLIAKTPPQNLDALLEKLGHVSANT